MWLFLKRLAGVSPEHEKAEKRYKDAQKELDKREEELDDLLTQVTCLSEVQVEKKKQLRKSSIDLTQTLNRSMAMPAMRDIRDEKDDEERPSGELTPTGAHG